MTDLTAEQEQRAREIAVDVILDQARRGPRPCITERLSEVEIFDAYTLFVRRISDLIRTATVSVELEADATDGQAEVDRLTPTERAQLDELVAAARATVDAINKLHADFAEAHADGASSNDIAQMLDDFLVGQGLPSVLYGGTR